MVPKRTHRPENNIWFTFPFVEWFGWFQTLLVPLGKCLPTCNFAAFFPRSTFISMKMFAGCDGTKHVKTLFWNWVPKKQSECPKTISIASQVAAIREKSCEKFLQKNGCQSPCSSLSSLSSYYIFIILSLLHHHHHHHHHHRHHHHHVIIIVNIIVISYHHYPDHHYHHYHPYCITIIIIIILFITIILTIVIIIITIIVIIIIDIIFIIIIYSSFHHFNHVHHFHLIIVIITVSPLSSLSLPGSACHAPGRKFQK